MSDDLYLPASPSPSARIRFAQGDSPAVPAAPAPPRRWIADPPPGTEVLLLTSLDVSEVERLLIVRALERTEGNRTAAAALVGMHPRTLRRKMRAMHIAPTKAARTDG